MSKVRFIVVDEDSETEVITCNNPDCEMHMIIVAVLYRKDEYEDPHLSYMNQCKMTYCPYCGEEQ